MFFGDILLGISFSLLVAAIQHRQEKRRKGVYAQFGQRIAACSYSLYLFHLPVLTIMCTWIAIAHPSFAAHHTAVMLCVAPAVFAVCYVFYLLFEANTDRVRAGAERLLQSRPVNRVAKSDSSGAVAVAVASSIPEVSANLS
jgi:peptidoglycan/LPS O-acetylase OafA/YrhL